MSPAWAVQHLAVVHTDLEAFQSQAGENLVNDRGDFRLVEDGKLAIADDIDIGLIKFPKTPPLRPLAAIHLADLIAAEGKGELAIVQGDVFCQRHGQIKAQRQVAIALLKAVDLLFGFAAALGEEHVRRLDDGRIQGSKAIEGIGFPQNGHHPFHLLLRTGKQFHKARKRVGFGLLHSVASFLRVFANRAESESRVEILCEPGEDLFPIPIAAVVQPLHICAVPGKRGNPFGIFRGDEQKTALLGIFFGPRHAGVVAFRAL